MYVIAGVALAAVLQQLVLAGAGLAAALTVLVALHGLALVDVQAGLEGAVQDGLLEAGLALALVRQLPVLAAPAVAALGGEAPGNPKS